MSVFTTSKFILEPFSRRILWWTYVHATQKWFSAPSYPFSQIRSCFNVFCVLVLLSAYSWVVWSCAAVHWRLQEDWTGWEFIAGTYVHVHSYYNCISTTSLLCVANYKYNNVHVYVDTVIIVHTVLIFFLKNVISNFSAQGHHVYMPQTQEWITCVDCMFNVVSNNLAKYKLNYFFLHWFRRNTVHVTYSEKRDHSEIKV